MLDLLAPHIERGTYYRDEHPGKEDLEWMIAFAYRESAPFATVPVDGADCTVISFHFKHTSCHVHQGSEELCYQDKSKTLVRDPEQMQPCQDGPRWRRRMGSMSTIMLCGQVVWAATQTNVVRIVYRDEGWIRGGCADCPTIDV